ncbi:MAG: DNA translocase FtsK [Polyangiaceae bacterium]
MKFARGREVAALLLWASAVYLLLALASFKGDPRAADVALAPGSAPPLSGGDWVGVVGAFLARSLVSMFGLVAWVLPLELALLGVPFVRGKKSNLTPIRLGGDILIALLAAALVQVGWPQALMAGRYPASGMTGELFGELLRSLFSTAGSFLIGFTLLGLILIGRATFSFIALMRWLGQLSLKSAAGTAKVSRNVANAWREARELDRKKKEEERLAALPRIGEAPTETQAIFVPSRLATDDDESSPKAPRTRASTSSYANDLTPSFFSDEPSPLPVPSIRVPRGKRPLPKDDATDVDGAPVAEIALPKPVTAGAGNSVETAPEEEAPDTDEEGLSGDEEGSDEGSDEEAAPVGAAQSAEEPAKPKRTRKSKEPAGPTIVDTSAALVTKKSDKALQKEARAKAKVAGFTLPSIDYLQPGKSDPQLSVDRDILFQNAELLVKTLADYGVSGKVEEILPGPTVTTYEVSPAAGTKVSKVASLADDLALALARKVRIVAPIPGKNRIGFELPNERRSPVILRDLVEDKRFQSMDAPLPVVMGRDIVGNPVYADLASMPHVIVAGATGAGKSVGLNVMLTSLLYRRTPDELRMLMIDPKVVELAPFDRIPHMLLPVVTDMKQAATALKWAVDEMERRYQLFADAGTKNIHTYNGWVDKVVRGEVKNPLPKTVVAKDPNGFVDEVAAGEDEEGEQKMPERMPFIVIVVDEFADLMMQQGKDVEVSVARLAQKARAAGMHVILATQRPSVDVITGMIKANFPTRIAFRVAQKVDSRTILDEQGAEHLLGRGDMLIRLNGTNETKRVQCPWVSEEEVQEVTDFLRTQGEPVYDENILKPRDEEGAADEEDAEQDSMYDEALRIVAETRRCSTSWLQRKLGLGYNRAARIVEMMEKRGVVGPAQGAKDREVLISAL